MSRKNGFLFDIYCTLYFFSYGYVDGNLGKEYGIEKSKIKKHIEDLDKNRERKPPKERKQQADTSYAPGKF